MIDSISHSSRTHTNHTDKIWQDQEDGLHYIKMTPSEVNNKCAEFYSLTQIHLNPYNQFLCQVSNNQFSQGSVWAGGGEGITKTNPSLQIPQK